ncbi:MAG: hypothetical protein LDL37_15930 [Asticcacaulis sp.]|uniref:hypothetical protein n=1 Tax=Asticcacaulis sp. TaxID=1872648 RepID=UPI0025BC440F|nr:hypothetical protein [Asticcacaulis sp.]MCA1936933.1 hypothetical protein [Asticcacaulis sp.]
MSLQILGFVANALSILAIPFAVLNSKQNIVPYIDNKFSAAMLFLAASVIFILCIKEYIEKNKGKTYKNDDEIKKAMFNIIKNSGSTVIVTRNMSWSNDKDIENELGRKSSHGDLKIYLQHIPNNLDEIANLKNSMKKYNLNFTPSCRFTISNNGHHNEAMHIAVPGNGKHSIYSYSSNDGPIFYLAKDLVRLLETS